MPSTFPPPSVERHHSRRRSGRHDDYDLEKGTYGSRPNSGPYNEAVNPPANYPYQPPRTSYENPNPASYQDRYDQAASRPPVGQENPGPTTAQYPSFNPHRDFMDARYASSYQPPTHQDAPHQGTPHPHHHSNNNNHRHPRGGGKPSLLSSLFNRNGTRIGNRTGRPGPGGGHTLQHQPSPLEPEARGGKWETIRGHLVAMSGEFVGTILFLWFALSATQVTAMTNPDPGQTPSNILFIALAFGFSLAVNAWSFYRISGGLFNPAVVLGMVVSGSLPLMRGVFLLPAQIIGGIIAAALVQCMFPGDVGTSLTVLAPAVHRDVPHRPARVHHPHARGRETSSYVPGSRGDRTGSFCGGIER